MGIPRDKYQKIVNGLGQKSHRCCKERSNCFLKIDTEGDKARCAGSLFQNLTIRTEKAPLLCRKRLGRFALIDQLEVGGGRNQMG